MAKRKIPEFLTKEEQEALINIFNTRYWTSCRNKMMVELDLATGLRLSELINLKWIDINLMTGQLKVVEGKGSKDRILWIDENTISKLTLWKEKQFTKLNAKVDYVFTNNKGKQLVDRDVRETIVTYANIAGITKKISPHTLRHTFATDLLRATNNLRVVQKAMGHEDIRTTAIYTHIVDTELEEAMKNFRR